MYGVLKPQSQPLKIKASGPKGVSLLRLWHGQSLVKDTPNYVWQGLNVWFMLW